MMTVATADTDSDGLEESELTALTKAQLRQVAADGGYDLTGATTKTAMITAILTASAVDTTGTLTETQLGYFTLEGIQRIAAQTARGYDLVSTTKANAITEFLTTQNVDTTGTLTETQLGYFTIARILAIATARSYTMTSTAETTKATVITEFLAAQEAAAISEGAGS